jgi:hypothetical protein
VAKHRADRKAHFIDDGTWWGTFAGSCLVRCPSCARCATVRGPGGRFELGKRWRLTCGSCGLAKVREFSSGKSGEAADPVFGCALWLQTGCGGQTLWAFGPGHLTHIEAFVRAELRECLRLDHLPGCRCNGSLASRYPRWMILRTNRQRVLRACGRLRRLLESRECRRPRPHR